MSAARARIALVTPCQTQQAARSWCSFGALSSGVGRSGVVLSGARHRACAPKAMASLPAPFTEPISAGG
jgi:hypothetical protein